MSENNARILGKFIVIGLCAIALAISAGDSFAVKLILGGLLFVALLQ